MIKNSSRSSLGTGRFTKLGFSHAAFWSSLTGCFEIACRLLLVVFLLGPGGWSLDAKRRRI